MDQQGKTIRTHISVRDIAREAGVSMSTARRSLNRPSMVAAATLDKVRASVRQLETEMERNGLAPRPTGELQAGRDGSLSGEPNPPVAAFPVESHPPGSRILVRRGSWEFTGVVDQMMPDGSGLWVWQDGGQGRIMLLAGVDRITDPDTDDQRSSHDAEVVPSRR